MAQYSRGPSSLRSLTGRLNRRTVLQVGAGAGAAAFAAACSSSSNSKSSSGSGAAASGKASPTPGNRSGTGDKDAARAIIGNSWNAVDGAPKYGGVLQYAPIAPTLANLDPILSASAMVHNVVGNAYSRLIKIGRTPEDQNAFVLFPDAAEKWEVADPTTLIFHLRPGITFHNIAPTNGRALSADDAKYSIERTALAKESQFQGAFSALDSVQVTDPQTVVVKLKRYDATLLRNLGGNAGYLVPKELAEGAGLKNAIAGTGPFIFDRWDQDSSVSFHRNPDYFIKGVPFVDQLKILFINDLDARITAFQTGQIIQQQLTSRQLQQVKAAAPTVQSQRYTYVSPYVLFMNFKEPMWKDDRVRKAVALSLDRDSIIKVATDGEGEWRGVISNQHPGWPIPPAELKAGGNLYTKRDPAEAKKLLAAAGFTDGFSTGLMFNSSYPQPYSSSTQYMQQAFADVGIKVELNGLEQATFRKNQDIQNYKGLIHGLDGQGQPEAFLLDYHTGGPKNGSGFSDPGIDGMIDDVTSTVDDNQRRSKALDLQRKLLSDVQYKIAIRDEFLHDAWHPWVKNLYSSPPQFYPTTELAYVWLVK